MHSCPMLSLATGLPSAAVSELNLGVWHFPHYRSCIWLAVMPAPSEALSRDHTGILLMQAARVRSTLDKGGESLINCLMFD